MKVSQTVVSSLSGMDESKRPIYVSIDTLIHAVLPCVRCMLDCLLHFHDSTSALFVHPFYSYRFAYFALPMANNPLNRILETNPARPVFLLHNWPDVVKSVAALVQALVNKKGQNARAVRKAMEKLCGSLAAFIDPANADSARTAEEGSASTGEWFGGPQSGTGRLLGSLERLQNA